ncbi:rhamnogalacturonan lyase [Streptomyces sp. TRM66268-LWL]|uniref:Rhamnogalacturonan lyase n=1 Tax=Streptomyces polyasparticus TaxID=2767826 RepID=A0ABR7SXE8_9ACTN|nr:rhamnogalacturonan lyase [Streptomyces polyasparticus]MBC9719335.1 rhamnogalacturonan lyase [Streptomyces polyasparticus]
MVQSAPRARSRHRRPRHVLAAVLATALLGGLGTFTVDRFAGAADDEAPSAPVNSAAAALAASRVAEKLDRGLVAVPASGGILVSWRMLGDDPSDVSFRLYRGSTLIEETSKTNFLDTAGSSSDMYEIRAVVGGTEKPGGKARAWASGRQDIPLQKPAGGTTRDGVAYTYSANDASAADLDGDGQYELVLKWVPSNATDVANSGTCTGPTIYDAYELSGERLWRINLGTNVRSGSHYDSFQVYDYDGDGRAEMAVRTSDGSRDSAGTVIGSATASHLADNCAVLSGPEYLSVFDGRTGRVMDSEPFQPARGSVADWGDTWGNREGRLLSATAYVSGSKPSMIFSRGIYERIAIAAYDWDGTQISRRWTFDSNSSTNYGKGYDQQGNHNLAVADVDGDGKDEILYGAMAVDDNGGGLWTTKLGHGDALHVGDLNPARPGLESFNVHEHTDSAYGFEMHDARTGQVLWGSRTGTDVGRGICADLTREHAGAECWSSGGGLYAANGTKISDAVPAFGGAASYNSAIWWDGDPHRELLDHRWSGTAGSGYGQILKYNGTAELTRIWADTEARSNNWTKGNPALTADLLGDWREEMLWRNADSTALRLYTTPHPTEYRLPTLMHDPVYRLGVAWQNTGYNQPPQVSYYLGTK